MNQIVPGLLLGFLIFAGCDEESSEVPVANQIVIESVKITTLPMVDRNGNPWDPSDGPDVFIQVFNCRNNVCFQNRNLAVSNTVLAAMPLSFPAGVGFDKSTDSCYVSVWDRDDAEGDPDDLMGSTNTWLSAARLNALGNPATYQMSDSDRRLRLELTIGYR